MGGGDGLMSAKEEREGGGGFVRRKDVYCEVN